MVPPSFVIEPDPAREFLRITMTGDWTMDTLDRFAAEVGTTLRTMVAAQGVRHGHLMTLVDMTRKGVLPQDVGNAMAAMVNGRDTPSRKIAHVVKGAIHKFQARRLSDDPRIRQFDTEAEAVIWLFEGHQPKGAHPR